MFRKRKTPPRTRSRTKSEWDVPEPTGYKEFTPAVRSSEKFKETEGTYEATFSGGWDPKNRTPSVGEIFQRESLTGEEEVKETNGEKPEKEEEKERKKPPTPKPRKMADTTIIQAREKPTNPATPKFISPPTYNPKCSNPINFIQTYERTAAANGWDDILKINYFSIFLEGAAQIWSREYISDAANNNKTWKDVKKDFIEEFGGNSAYETAKTRWRNRKQGPGEDIKSYYYDLIQLKYDYDPQMSDETFKDHFTEGLSPSLFQLYHMFSTPKMSTSELKNLVFKISEVQQKNMMTDLMVMGGRNERKYGENSGNSGRYGNDRENFQGGSRGYGNSVPNTRTRDGRPKCYYCDKPGHFARSCEMKKRDLERRAAQEDTPAATEGPKNAQGRRD